MLRKRVGHFVTERAGVRLGGRAGGSGWGVRLGGQAGGSGSGVRLGTVRIVRIRKSDSVTE